MPGEGKSSGDITLGEIYLEMRQVGKAQRITAIDPDTGIEVIFTAPVKTPRIEIESLARNKLTARVARERAKTASVAQPAYAQRGRLV